MTADQRIKLAEFVDTCVAGWPKHDPSANAPQGGCLECGRDSHFRFDPRNDANDCEALIRKLGDHGFEPRINFWVSHVDIRLDHNGHPDGPKIHRYSGQNWKHGVCDLAEKIIEQQESSNG